MAYLSRVSYTGNNSTVDYSIPFSYIVSSHIYAWLDSVATTAFTISGSTLTFTTAPGTGVAILIRRITPTDARLVDFTDGSVLTESDLDQSADQNFYIAQESSDTAQTHLALDNSSLWDADSKRIINVANPTGNQDAATKHYLENTWLSTSDKANITTLAGISGNITTVAGISANVTSVAGDATDIGVVAGKATEIGRLGTADAVADLAILGTADVVTDMNVLATADVVTDMNTLGTADVVTDMNTLATADVVTDMNTLATADVVADMNTLATADVVTDMNTLGTADVVSDMNTLGTAGNVTAMDTCATNITGINSFADRYRVGTTNPASSLDDGDLFFNTTDNALKYYDGSSWASITAGIGSLADDTTPQLGANLDLNGNDIVSTSNADIDIIPNGTGDVNLGTDTVQVGDNNANATITTQGTGDLTLNTNNGSSSGNITLEDGANGDITITPNGSGEVVIDGLIHPQADGNTGEFLKTDGAGNLDFAVVSGADITTEGNTFSNYNSINSTMATVLASGKNYALFGTVTVTSPYVWTVTGEPLVFI